MISINKKNNKTSPKYDLKRGFVMLFAVILSSIVLAITLGVMDIAIKEIKFGSPAKESNDASFAADVGIECALFNDKSTSNVFVPSGGTGRVQCLGANPPLGVAVINNYPDFDFRLSSFGPNNRSCARVHVNKNGAVTTITSKGYNVGDLTCVSAAGNRVEREYIAIVGGPVTPIPPPFSTNFNLDVTLAGSGTGVVTSNPAGISCGSACSALFMDGTGVDLSAVPDAGFVFGGWSGGGCPGTGICSLVMDSDKTVTALFNLPPPPSQIFLVGANSTAGTSVTIPAHQSGDLIVVFAYRDGNNTAPSLPVGWTNIGTPGGANSNSSRLAYRVATGSGTTSGTWTNATELVTHVYRGQDSAPIGVNGNTGAVSTTITYPGLSLSVTNGTSFVVGFAGHRSINTNVQSSPSGMSNRTTATGAGKVAGHDTNGGVSSWGATGVSVGGTSGGWRARTLEIISN